MTKKALYPYSPETRMGETLRDLNPKGRNLVLRRTGVVQDAIRFNEDFDEVNKTKILQEKVKDEIEKTFNGITSFNHIKALYKLMGEYPNWDVTKIKLKPNCIEFEVEIGEIIKLSVADLPGKLTWPIAFEEVKKFNLDIPKMGEWDRLISLMPGNGIKEMTKNFKKLCNLKNGKYLSSSHFNGKGQRFLAPNFENRITYHCDQEEVINVRGILK